MKQKYIYFICDHMRSINSLCIFWLICFLPHSSVHCVRCTWPTMPSTENVYMLLIKISFFSGVLCSIATSKNWCFSSFWIFIWRPFDRRCWCFTTNRCWVHLELHNWDGIRTKKKWFWLWRIRFLTKKLNNKLSVSIWEWTKGEEKKKKKYALNASHRNR